MRSVVKIQHCTVFVMIIRSIAKFLVTLFGIAQEARAYVNEVWVIVWRLFGSYHLTVCVHMHVAAIEYVYVELDDVKTASRLIAFICTSMC